MKIVIFTGCATAWCQHYTYSETVTFRWRVRCMKSSSERIYSTTKIGLSSVTGVFWERDGGRAGHPSEDAGRQRTGGRIAREPGALAQAWTALVHAEVPPQTLVSLVLFFVTLSIFSGVFLSSRTFRSHASNVSIAPIVLCACFSQLSYMQKSRLKR